MWQLSSNQFTARITDAEKEKLNSVIAQMQEDGQEITSAKDALFALINVYQDSKNGEVVRTIPTVVEEIKEVESELGENEHIIVFTPDQERILNVIAENRAKKSSKEPLRNPVEQIKHMAFQKHVLEDHWGNYFTGL